MLKLLLLPLVAWFLFPAGRRQVVAGVRNAARLWRPTAGLFAVVVLMASAVLAVREDWWIALLLLAPAAALALAARKRTLRAAPASLAGGMSRTDARSILGVPEGADRATVDAAYRRLIRFAHPDQGGTPGLAAQLNAARAALRGG